MAYITFPGTGRVVYPAWPHGYDVSTSSMDTTTMIIDAAGEKIALMGRFWSPDFTSKTIDTISTQLGNIVSAGGSVVRVSLQDISTASSPTQPDGTQDQYRDVTLSTWSSNTWVTTGLLTDTGADGGGKRTVNHGDLLAVVFEFNSFAGSDILRVATNTWGNPVLGPHASLYTASWAIQNRAAALLFTCSDASLATFYGGLPRTGNTLTSYHSGSNPDEYGQRFIAPCDMKVDGVSGQLYINGYTADFDVTLYQDTTALHTVSIDATQIGITGNYRWNHVPFTSKVTLTKDVEYIIGIRPTTTNSVSAPMIDVANASHLGLWPGGTDSTVVTRTDLGSWTASPSTRRWAHLSVCVSDIDVGGGSGGGGPLIGGRLIR